jgi:hypothetical protein
MNAWMSMVSQLGTRLRRGVSGQGVLAVGGILLLALIVAAILLGPETGGTPRIEPGTVQALGNMGSPQGVAVAMPGLTPFVPMRPLQFAGRVTQVVSIGADVGWGQLHIWINDGSGTLLEISLAPKIYLDQIGCPSFDNARVSGVGFIFDPARPNAELYAREIVVAGTTCRLRDDEGLALWMNPTQ